MHVTTFSIHEPETAQIWQLIESHDSWSWHSYPPRISILDKTFSLTFELEQYEVLKFKLPSFNVMFALFCVIFTKKGTTRWEQWQVGYVLKFIELSV